MAQTKKTKSKKKVSKTGLRALKKTLNYLAKAKENLSKVDREIGYRLMSYEFRIDDLYDKIKRVYMKYKIK